MATETMPAVVQADETSVFAKQANRMLETARALQVGDATSFEMASTALLSIKTKHGEIQAFFEPMAAKAYATWKEITGRRGEILKPLEAAESDLKSKLLVFQRAEEAKRRAEQAEAQAKARAEHQALLDAQAQEAAAAGATEEEVTAIVEQAPPPPVPFVAPAAPEVVGVSKRQNWKAQVVDMVEFAKFQAGQPRGGLLDHPDVRAAIEKVLTQQAKGAKSTMNIPGVRVWDDGSIAVNNR